jgi:predicted nucleotidyltransferase
MNLIKQKSNIILELCRRHRVKNLYAFGSILTDGFNDRSDIDLVVDFKRMPLKNYSDNYYAFKFSLEDSLNRRIDLLEYKAIKNPYLLENINKHKKLIYGN